MMTRHIEDNGDPGNPASRAYCPEYDLDLPALPDELAALEAAGLEKIQRKEAQQEAARVAAEQEEARKDAAHWQALQAAVRGDLPGLLHSYLESEAPKGWSSKARHVRAAICLPGRAPIWIHYHYGDAAGWQRQQPARLLVPGAVVFGGEANSRWVSWSDGAHHEPHTLAGALGYAALEGRRFAQLEREAGPLASMAGEDDVTLE